MNGLMGSNDKGSPFLITNSSPLELHENRFKETIQANGIERVYFVGGGTTNYPIIIDDPKKIKRAKSATESLSIHQSGLDCRTLEIVERT